jgi:hypothetical protein
MNLLSRVIDKTKTGLPAVKSDDFDPYAEALIALEKSAEKLTGPADGQSVVEAVLAFGRQLNDSRIAAGNAGEDCWSGIRNIAALSRVAIAASISASDAAASAEVK